jgi:hypothetical protein
MSRIRGCLFTEEAKRKERTSPSLNIKILATVLKTIATRHRGDDVDNLTLEGELASLLLSFHLQPLLLLLLQQLEQQLQLGSCEGVLAQHLQQAQQEVRASALKAVVAATQRLNYVLQESGGTAEAAVLQRCRAEAVQGLC